MLCFPQMATQAQITAEQYLHMTFEYDAEFAHGHIAERSLPDLSHSRVQAALAMRFGQVRKLHGCPGVRMKVAAETYRVAGVAVFCDPPREDYPESPPFVRAEVTTKDDRYHDLMEKLEEYRLWGVAHIWVVDPLAKRFSLYTELGLQNVSSLALRDYAFELTPADLFGDL